MASPALVPEPSGSVPDFASIFEGELDYVWRTLRRLGVRPADLDDEVNEVFFRVHRQLSTYDQSRPLRPWLFAFAARVAAEYRRSLWVRREVHGVTVEAIDPAPTAEEQAVEGETRALVLAALESLEQTKREVFVAVEIDGHSGPEVAAALGIPLNTAYSRLRLARQEFTAAIRRLQKAGVLP